MCLLTADQFHACATKILEKIDNGESFTAYDITLALRADGHWVEHKDVREYVHDFMRDEMDSGREYRKDLEWVTPTAQAFVYSPDEEDVVVDDDEGGIETDARGRLCIPATFVRMLGATTGDVVYCETGGQTGLPLLLINTDGYGHHSYVVDKDENVRISRRVLNGTLEPSKSYRVDFDSNTGEIVVTSG